MTTYFSPAPAEALRATVPSPESRRAEDAELAARFRLGTPAFQGASLVHYRPHLYAFAFRLTRNHHDAEDLVQETLLRAFRAAARFRGEATLGTWLHTIARNLAYNRYWHWRRRKGDATVSLDSPGAEGDANAWQKAIAVDERATAEEQELERCVAEAIDRLPERHRTILDLRIRQHASYEEIARSLGVGLGTVKSRLARARERLRAYVEASGGFEARPELQQG